ncbi:TonB-dependent receptor [Tahibacter soli]|uniref:TonB-dependent receptor n=1 Tax=Tahibacter soli TaxID=2983605 RepID=A0A9X3YPW5_9GAMM|nr:TonB-dependent receptor [Tahibacter soli]MDC8015295.1 TonB-dependent receptor [Tahibacter soli]
MRATAGRFIRCASLVVSATFAANAHNAADAADADGERGAAQLDEIVVTANRRAQPADDVGASVDVLDGASLKARGVTSTADLHKLVPGLTAADTGVNVPAYSIRGIGLNDPSLASNSTVAISVDEVPLPYAAMSQGRILDMRRIEVLKGPQGTLYGQNATGGAINYVANRPGDAASFGGSLGLARFDGVAGEGYVDVPVGDTLTARVAVGATQGGAWQKNFTRDDALGRVDKGATRALLNWRPDDRLDVDLAINGWVDRSDTQATQIVAFRPQVAANAPRVPDVFSSPIPPADAGAANWNPDRDYARDDRFRQMSLKVAYDLRAGTTLTSITAYSDYDTRAFNDRDGMAPANFEFATTGRIESTYQELRVSDDTAAMAWSAGGNFRRDRTRDFQSADVSRATNTFIAGMKLNTVDFWSAQNVKTHAAFADAELRLTPRLSALAGVRYTKDQRDFSGSTCDDGDGETSAVYTYLSNTYRAQFGLPPLPPIGAGECVTLSTDTFTPGIVEGRLVEDNVAFRGQLNVKATDRSLVYASFSRGYKAGSFPTLSTVFAPGYDPATQERVDAVETGFNAAAFDRRLRVHGAFFRYDYRDKQFRGRVLDPVVGNLSKLVNIPRSVVTGAEFNLETSPLPGLTLQSAVAWLDTEVKEFVGVNLYGRTEDFAGQTLPFSPPWSANVAGRYEWNLRGGLKAFAGADIAWRSRTSGFLGRDRPADIDAWATLDLRAGIGSGDDRWQVTLWGNNVTDAYYATTAMRVGDTFNAYAARPATYGILLSYSN